jgi:hypothetical protein
MLYVTTAFQCTLQHRCSVLVVPDFISELPQVTGIYVPAAPDYLCRAVWDPSFTRLPSPEATAHKVYVPSLSDCEAVA